MSVKTGAGVGLLRRAIVEGIDLEKAQLICKLAEVSSAEDPQTFRMRYPATLAGANGKFSGGHFERGDNIVIGMGPGGEWFYVTSLLPNFASDFLSSPLRSGRILFQTSPANNSVSSNRLFLDPNGGIQFGDANNFIHADPQKEISLFSNNFQHQLYFSEAHRSITGLIKRDLAPNSNRGVTGSTLDSHAYESTLKPVPMDKSSIESSGGVFPRNLPLVESRELIYELANSFLFVDDNEEAAILNNNSRFKNSKIHKNRRNSRADTLSLSLVRPNQLMEIVKGTVVDVFGNVLDLNRSALPIGKTEKLSLNTSSDKSDAFARIRRELRKSIVYHFEINARKDTVKDPTNPEVLPPSNAPDVSSISDYARDRSRFYIDIDKEGQFKINVPSSSETGNVPLLTRYENISTLRAAKDGTNPDIFERNVDGTDIAIENFATKSTINLSAGDTTLEGFASPIDRVTQQPMKLGTAYHDISQTVSSHQSENPAAYRPNNLINNPNDVPPLERIVSNEIIVSGKNADAGGRSGAVNLDGFISLNIGANTVDRQSMWFDYAGGVVGRIGRDIRGVSYAVSMDGDLLLQIGGSTIGNDSRFQGPNSTNNAFRSGAVDIRVMTTDGGEEDFAEATIIRIDRTGVRIITPGRLDIEAEGNIKINAGAHLILNGDRIFFYGDKEIENTAGTSNAREIMRSNLSV